jgi:hypothetical protein
VNFPWQSFSYEGLANLFKRPSVYFDQQSKRWPEGATLTVQTPPMIEKAFDDPIAVIEREYEELQAKARQQMKEIGRTFMGADRVTKVSPYQRATSWENLRFFTPSPLDSNSIQPFSGSATTGGAGVSGSDGLSTASNRRERFSSV